MFGLDLDATDQLCVLPVIKRQAIHWPHPKQETSIDSCREEEHTKWAIQWELFTSKIRSLLHNNVHVTFSSKVGLKRFLFLEVFEDFDDTVAFSDGISVIKEECISKISALWGYRAGNYLIDYKCHTYSDESCAQTNSCAEPKLLFLKAIAV